jgi:hypothetical protein
MSFRLFIYYCALCGGWAALVGWALGRVLSPSAQEADPILVVGIKGMWLGLLVALGLGLVDALWNLSLQRFGLILMRVTVALLVGLVGGFIGGALGQWLLDLWAPLYVLGWTLTGLLVGASIGVFEVLSGMVTRRDQAGAMKKMLKCLTGGTVGGLLGGVLSLLLGNAFTALFHRDRDFLWTPTSWGFVALGMCIGLLIGLAQVILKEAWIKVEAGFRAGREMIISKERTTVGRAEACDIGLFGDPAVEKLHAQIVLAGNRYYLEDARTPSGTYVNDRPVSGRTPLQSGDLIRVGRNLLRFRERQKRNSR